MKKQYIARQARALAQALALWVSATVSLGAAAQTAAAGAAPGAAGMRVTGAALEEMVKGYYVTAGFNPVNGCVFIVVNHSPTRREQYADCVGQAGTAKGSARIDGDRLCTKWEYRDELCSEVHRVGENQLEMRGPENRVVRVYRLK